MPVREWVVGVVGVDDGQLAPKHQHPGVRARSNCPRSCRTDDQTERLSLSAEDSLFKTADAFAVAHDLLKLSTVVCLRELDLADS